MSIVNKENIQEINRYKEFIDTRSEVSLMQSIYWSNVKSDWEKEFVYIEKDGNIIAAITLLVQTTAKIFSVIYAPRGPVCDIYDFNIVDALMHEVDKVAKKYNAFLFRMDPEVKYDEKLEQVYKSKGFIVRAKNTDLHDLIQPRCNMIMNIEGKTEEEIFKGYSEKTRYNIRYGLKRGVNVRYSRDTKDIDVFYNLYKITGIRDKITIRKKDYYKKILENFDDNRMRIYIAEHEGIPLSAAIAINYGSKLFYIYGASSNERRNLMPNYAMQQEMIKWAVETNCKYYDFGGVFYFDKSDGLYKFKEGFCRQEGFTEFIGEIDKVYSNSKYFAFTKLLPMYKKIRKSFKVMFDKKK